MNSFIDRIRNKRQHKRQSSSASRNSSVSNDDSVSSTTVGGGQSGLKPEEPVFSGSNLDVTGLGLNLHESPSFSAASLKLIDNPPTSSSEDSASNKTSPTTANTAQNQQRKDANHFLPHSDTGLDLSLSATASDSTMISFRRRKSRLSRTLQETLSDPTSLGYFLTYMDSQNLRHLVKFWLEAETFRVAAHATFKRLEEMAKNDQHQHCAVKNGAEHDHAVKPGMVYSADQDSAIFLDGDCNGRMESMANALKYSSLMQMTEQDAVTIFFKYLSKESTHSIGVTDNLRNEIIDKICLENGRLDPECFVPAQNFIVNIMQIRYYPEYLKSVQYCKHLIEILTAGPVYVTDMLYDETALFHFIEFMEQEKQLNLLEFWLAAENFRDKLKIMQDSNISSAKHAQADAMTLYNKYFSLQATCPLGFSDECRTEIENNICKLGGPSLDCFEKLTKYVLIILEQKFLPKFLQSHLYQKYFNELLNTANSDLDLPSIHKKARRCRTGSDVSSGTGRSSDSSSFCSSATTNHNRQQHHVTNHSTISNSLLAHESPKAALRRYQMTHTSAEPECFSIDSKTYDPDSLWKRHKPKLSLGHVDAVGRYITEAEQPDYKHPVPGRKKIKDTVKKMVFGDKKEQEELAEQVAALIVQDVQNLTKMANGGENDEFFP